ncbi:MAG: metallophosphoesterase [Eubacterium sp.]|nr:metallophosphoesterase [Eubacterium sp.]MBR4241024.1 metallophosphoesterase [Eubacterium sp.]
MIYVTGDTHGDINFFKSAKLKKLTEDDTLIICGDFGFLWNGSDKEKKALDILKKKKYTICFVDGAHENYEMLATYQPYRFKGGNANKIADNIFRLLRGEIFTFEGKTFFCMGGGESEDAHMRVEGKTWWKEEMPSTEELMNGAQNLKDNEYKIDYVLTYEAPALAKDFIRLHTNQEMHLTPLNNYLQELMKSVEYEHWYFGSLHMDLNISKKMTAVFNEVIAIK